MKMLSRLLAAVIVLACTLMLISSCEKQAKSTDTPASDKNIRQSDVQSNNEDNLSLKGEASLSDINTQQSDAQVSNEDKTSLEDETISSDIIGDNDSDIIDLRELLNHPGLPFNYTFEFFEEVDNGNAKTSLYGYYESVARKDDKYLVTKFNYDGPDKGKPFDNILIDTTGQIVLHNSIIDKFALIERKEKNAKAFAEVGHGLGRLNPIYENSNFRFRKTGEENIDGYPCDVYDVIGEGAGKVTLYVSKDLNVILKKVSIDGQVTTTSAIKGLKIGEVTDEMVKIKCLL